jgi:hypothetical protein
MSATLRRNWNGVAAVIAAFVGLLALCVSGYTAYLQRQQVRAQVWPHLIVGSSDTDRYMFVANKGVGPAIVRSVQISANAKTQRDWTSVFAAVDLKLDNAQWNTSTVNGNVISPGESIRALVFNRGEDYQAFGSRYGQIKLRICYCSVLGDCWVIDNRQHDPSQKEQEIAQCLRDESLEFHDFE